MRRRGRPPYVHNNQQQEKNKNTLVDQDEFQQVISRKITRNMFENGSTMGGNQPATGVRPEERIGGGSGRSGESKA